MSKIRKIVSIEQDTAILPYAVADGVIAEAEGLMGRDLPDKEAFVDKLEKKANEVYAHNSEFRKSIRASGDRGRDQLYVWMRHWLSADIKREYPGMHSHLPASFSLGSFEGSTRAPSAFREAVLAHHPSLPPGTKRG